MARAASGKRIWSVVVARMGSERLPGKSMALLASKPVLEHIVVRVRRSHYLQGVVLATTDRPEDAVLEDCAGRLRIPVFRGSAADVLGRMLAAARLVAAEVIVEITGDCPLVDPAIVDRVVEAYLRDGPDYAANIIPPTYPNGMDVQVFSTGLLAQIDRLTANPIDREHGTLFIYERPERYQLVNVVAPPEHRWPDLRLTLDTAEDYALIAAVYEALYPRNPLFGLSETLAYLRARPDLLALNKEVVQKPVRPDRPPSSRI